MKLPRVPMITRERLRRHRLKRLELREQLRAAVRAKRAARALEKQTRKELREMPTVRVFAQQLGVDSKVMYGIAQRKKPYCDLPEASA